MPHRVQRGHRHPKPFRIPSTGSPLRRRRHGRSPGTATKHRHEARLAKTVGDVVAE
jgi:hypothetical protein